MIKENTKINLESELIETLKASENKLHFVIFIGVGKLLGNWGDRTSSFYDLEDFTYVHTQDHVRGKFWDQKGSSWPSKMACRIGKNESYRNYSSNFDEPAYHFGVQVLGAPPMYGYNRVLGQLSRRNGDQRKYKNQPRVRIDRDSQSKWEQAPISSFS